MGCVNTKYTPPRNCERLKRNKDHADTTLSAPKDYPTTHSSTFKHVEVNFEEETEKKISNDKEIRDTNKVVARNDDKSNEVGNVTEENKKNDIERYEFVEGWPKWLVDNIPQNVLASLVPKTADSYEKLEKVIK